MRFEDFSHIANAGTIAPGQMANVQDYGADPTGTQDSTLSLQRACDENQHVFLPPGRYMVSQVTIKSNVTLQGAGSHSSVILAASPTGNVLTFAGCGWTLRDLMFDSLQDRADGAYVYSGGDFATIQNLAMTRQYTGIELDGTWTADIRNITAYNGTPEETAAGGAVIRLGRTCYTGPVHISGISARPESETRQPSSCIALGWVDVVSISDALIIWHRKELLIAPEGKQFAALIEVTNCCFDTAENGMFVQPRNGARVLRCGFANTWFGAHQSGDGIVVDGSDGVATGLQFTNCMFLHNRGNGISVTGSGADGLYFSNCFSSSNTGDGLLAAQGARNIVWTGGVLGQCHEGGPNLGYGCAAQPGCGVRIINAGLGGNQKGTMSDPGGTIICAGTY